MPNWIEGTLKLRGKRRDIERFFDDGTGPANWPNPEDRKNPVTKSVELDNVGVSYGVNYYFRNCAHITGTRRAFIEDGELYIEHEYDEEDIIACIDIRQAWAFDAGKDSKDLDNWKRISEEYNLDLRLYGIECGMMFCQEIIIIRGREAIVNEWQYENWDWECPFPRKGG